LVFFRKSDLKISIVTCSLLLSLFFYYPLNIVSHEESGSESYNLNTKNSEIVADYEIHDQITINGNLELIDKSTTENWAGNGSKSSPIMITGFNITSDSGDLLSIMNTNLYIVISYCFFDGGFNGIVFTNVTNALLTNNLVQNSGNAGIFLSSTYECIIQENNVTLPSWVGIWLENSPNNKINTNLVMNTGSDGISLHTQSGNCEIKGNNVTRSGHYGFYISESANCFIYDNFVLETSYAGIETSISPNSTIQNNLVIRNIAAHSIAASNCPYSKISDNRVYGANTQGITIRYSPHSIINNNWVQDDYYGIFLNFSDNSTITNNVFDNNYFGIQIHHKSENSRIIHNKISHSIYRGIDIFQTDHCIIKYNLVIFSGVDIYISESSNNTVILNDFIDNGRGTDTGNTGIANNISHNHWNAWIAPDSDSNGIVDLPYSLGSNSDDFPYVKRIHFLHPFSIIFPKGGDNLNGTITIRWSSSTDSLGFGVTYSIYYSQNMNDWIIIEANLISTIFDWETTSVPDSSYFLLVNATSESVKGLEISNITMGSFLVNNTIISESSNDSSITNTKTTPISVFWIFEVLILISIYTRIKKTIKRNRKEK